ncbi:MAG: serine/threonine protein kinase [Myxococcales bacterium]|nr:serine/threonine protein kinase [Myxococcales bacterium]
MTTQPDPHGSGLAPGPSVVDRLDLEGKVMFSRLSASLFGEEVAPATIGRFSVVRRLGEGGMGVVYEAEDPTLGRRVAVKLLHRRWSDDGHARLHREARALALLSHPNVVQVYEVGVHQGVVFIAMELVAGTTLERWRSQGRSWQECVAVYAQAGEALAAAHRVGLVHRDFKPSNAVIDDDGRVRVLDFGLACGTATTDPGSSPSSGRGATLDAAAGTPAFMSPEQVRREELGPASDQFSFCVALFGALSGGPPFPSGGPQARLEAIEAGRIAPLPRSIPRRLHRVLRRGLHPDPARRFPSMEELVEHLRRPPSRRWAWLGALTLGGSLVVLLRPSDPSPCAQDRPLAQTWGEDQAARIRERFAATGHPDGATLAESVVRSLDAEAQRWHEARAAVCGALARADDGSVHVRLACLDAHRRELGALVDLLEHPDRDVVVFGPEMVGELSPADECLGPWRPRGEAPGVEIAPDVLRQRTRVAQARFYRSSGRYVEARELLGSTEAVARMLHHGPLLAAVLIERGRVEERTGNREVALDLFDEAIDVALRSDDVESEVEARLQSARVMIYPLEQLDRAEGELDDVRARVAALPHDSRRDGELHMVLGFLAEARGDPSLARQELTVALEQLGQDPRRNDLAISETRLLLGNVASLQGAPEEALEHYREVLSIRSRALGERHPLVGMALLNIGIVEAERGELDAAERALTEAVDILQDGRARSQHLVELAGARIGLAELLTARGEPNRALALAREADAMLAEGYPTTHSQRVAAREALCNALEEAGDAQGVLECYRALLGLHAAGAEQLEPVALQINIGSTLVELGWDSEARAHYERTLPDLRRQLEERGDVAVLGLPLYTYAQVLERMGDVPGAVAQLEQARIVLDVEGADLDPSVAEVVLETASDVAWSLARLQPRSADAVGLAREALAYYQSRDDELSGAMVAEISQWLDHAAR